MSGTINDSKMLEAIGNSVVTKFVNEELMTKSELSANLDAVMEKYTKHLDKKFELIDSKFKHMEGRFTIMTSVVLGAFSILVATTISLFFHIH